MVWPVSVCSRGQRLAQCTRLRLRTGLSHAHPVVLPPPLYLPLVPSLLSSSLATSSLLSLVRRLPPAACERPVQRPFQNSQHLMFPAYQVSAYLPFCHACVGCRLQRARGWCRGCGAHCTRPVGGWHAAHVARQDAERLPGRWEEGFTGRRRWRAQHGKCHVMHMGRFWRIAWQMGRRIHRRGGWGLEAWAW